MLMGWRDQQTFLRAPDGAAAEVEEQEPVNGSIVDSGEGHEEVEDDPLSTPPEGEEGDDDETRSEETGDELNLADVWGKLGVTGLPEDVNQLVDSYNQSFDLAEQNRQLQNQLQWLAHQQRQAQQAAQQQFQQQAVPQRSLFNLPEFDREWLNMVTRDEAGNLVAKNGVDPTLPQKIEAYARAREAQIDGFLKDPMAALSQGIAPFVQQLVQQQTQAQLRQYQQVSELRQYERENAAWIWTNGPGSQLTHAANVFNKYYSEAQQLGVPDPIAYARRGLDAEVAPLAMKKLHELQQAGSQQAQNKQKDQQFLQRAAKQASRSPATPAASKGKKSPVRSAEFPRNRLLEKLKALPPGALDL